MTSGGQEEHPSKICGRGSRPAVLQPIWTFKRLTFRVRATETLGAWDAKEERAVDYPCRPPDGFDCTSSEATCPLSFHPASGPLSGPLREVPHRSCVRPHGTSDHRTTNTVHRRHGCVVGTRVASDAANPDHARWSSASLSTSERHVHFKCSRHRSMWMNISSVMVTGSRTITLEQE